MNGQKTESVKYLKSHSEELGRRLQQLLDRQWDGLSERKGRWIVSARAGIDKTMSELLDTQTALAELYQAEISSRRAWLERTKLIQDKITVLTSQIETIEKKSDLASEINSLEKEQSGINEEIAQLQFKLKQLYSRKQEIASRLNQLQSTVEARTASYKQELESINQDNENGGGEGEKSGEQVERYNREVDAIKDQESTAQQEIIALKDGLVVWRDVCMNINELESGLMKSVSEKKDPSGIYNDLEKASINLKRNLQLAENNKWSLLSVAISHELEALNEGMQLIKNSTGDTPE